MRWLAFIFSHSVFIAICAGAMCVQTYLVTELPINWSVCFFVFFSTLASYNFYWLISKYAFKKNKSLHAFFISNLSYLILFLLAGMASLYYALQLPQLFLWALLGAVLTLLYSLPLWPFSFVHALPKPGFLKTVLLAFTWAYVITVFPMAENLPENKAVFLLLFSARFFFMLMLCSIFDMRDAAIDKIHLLKSLATSVSVATLQRIMVVTFFLYLLSGVAMRVNFSTSQQLIAFMMTGMLLWWVYRLSLQKRGYFFYYFVVDGLMLFSALATIVAHWV